MRCRKCGAPAAINMREHKLSLCGTHYLDWFVEKTERTIKKFAMFKHSDHILVAVSGGKDSLALWDVLLKLGFYADGLYIDLGIDKNFPYSAESKAKAETFAAQYPNARLLVVDLAERYGASMAQIAQRKRKGARICALCGLIKRHEMNRVALESGYDVLATGHNLDDEVAVLFGNVMQWKTGYLARQGPVLPADGEGLARKVKPLCRFYERETAAYTLLRGIDYIYAECPFAVGATSLAYKETLAHLEHGAPGTKVQFYLKFLAAKASGAFAGAEPAPTTLQRCQQCGQPTTATTYCSFCRLWLPEEKSEINVKDEVVVDA